MAGIKDVAKRAGVSISTVSYVMSGKRKIKKETQRRVREAALELGYKPVIEATSENGKSTKVLAVSSPLREYTDVSNYASFFFALAGAAKKYDYDILLLMHEAGDKEMIRIAEKGIVDGIFLLDVLLSDSRAETAATLDIPVVSIGYTHNTSSVYSIDLDFASMGREAVEKMHALGHRNILMCCPDRRTILDGSNFLVRFHDAARRRGEELGMTMTRVFSNGSTTEAATLMVDEAFAADPHITAVLCLGTSVSMQNLSFSLQRKGLRVPQDVSVLMTCDNPSPASRNVDEMPLNPNVVCNRAQWT